MGLIISPLLIIYYVLVMEGMGFNFSAINMHTPHPIYTFVAILVLIPFILVSQILTAGIYRRAIMQIRGGQPSVGEMFNLEGQGKQVMIFAAIVGAVAGVQQVLNFLFQSLGRTNPNMAILGSLVILVLAIVVFAFEVLILFTPMIIVDQKMDAVDAIKLSISTLTPHFFPLIGVIICGVLFAYVIGLVACFVGIIFTLPSLILLAPTIYNDFFRPLKAESGQFPNWYPRGQ